MGLESTVPCAVRLTTPSSPHPWVYTARSSSYYAAVRSSPPVLPASLSRKASAFTIRELLGIDNSREPQHGVAPYPALDPALDPAFLPGCVPFEAKRVCTSPPAYPVGAAQVPSPPHKLPEDKPSARKTTPSTTERPVTHSGTGEKTSSVSSIRRKHARRVRTVFLEAQLQRLEEEFEQQQYLAGEERRTLAKQLNLTEVQLKVWFQNRRIKWRKNLAEIAETSPISNAL